AIVSPTGGSVGIGFAIPSEIVQPIISDLRNKGHIERGWLGVSVQDSQGDAQGVTIMGVEHNGPAARAGLRQGDVVTAVNGDKVEHADNGRDGLFMAASETFDAVILDRMLPGGIDGLRLLETLRAQKNSVPVLFLSALGEVDDRVRGLKAGGDDYLTKPFAFAELLARIEALLRRRAGSPHTTRLKVEDLEFDLLTRRVTRGGREVELKARELKLLEF